MERSIPGYIAPGEKETADGELWKKEEGLRYKAQKKLRIGSFFEGFRDS